MHNAQHSYLSLATSVCTVKLSSATPVYVSPSHRRATQVSRGMSTGITETPTNAEGPRMRSSSRVQPTAVSGAAQRLWKKTMNSLSLEASFACKKQHTRGPRLRALSATAGAYECGREIVDGRSASPPRSLDKTTSQPPFPQFYVHTT